MKKTIKVIDLYNMISKGSTPKKIKYNTKIYEYDKEQDDYSTFVISNYEYLLDDINITSQLNDEVEILDEEEFEDIEPLVLRTFERTGQAITTYRLEDYCDYNFEKIEEKINQLIKNQKKIIERLNKDK